MIRAASTLLQELWDGKLRATVKSFTKKVLAAPALSLLALSFHPSLSLYPSPSPLSSPILLLLPLSPI